MKNTTRNLFIKTITETIIGTTRRVARLSALTAMLIMLPALSLQPQPRAADNQAVLILFPLAVYSESETTEALSRDTAVSLADNLRSRGMNVLDAADASGSALSVEERRNQAREKGADYALWGSLTSLGKGFSLDMTLIKAEDPDFRHQLFRQGDTMTDLSRAASDLSGDILFITSGRDKIIEVRVEGADRIDDYAVRRVITVQPGDPFDPRALSRDLKNIYDMGYFQDVRVTAEDGDNGKVVSFHIEERPTIRRILVKKNTLFEDEEIIAELGIKRGAIINIVQIRNGLRNIERLYKNKNYHNINVTYEVVPQENNQADLELTVEQGGRFRIQQIVFEGNRAYSDKELKKIIKTAEKGIVRWMITAAGNLRMDELQQDIGRLAAHYHNRGYIDARIGEPQIVYGEPLDTPPDMPPEEAPAAPVFELANGMFSEAQKEHLARLDEQAAEKRAKGIYITFKIEEGRQYHVGEVSLSGDLIKSSAELKERLQITEAEIFDRSRVQRDLIMLDSLYSDQGYYYANIYPETRKDDDTLTVDISYVIIKGSPVFFDNIIIAGNTKTRDKVIRRQLDVYEQELYSGHRLKRSIANLYRLNYFEAVNVDTVEKPEQDAIDLKIEVVEKPTGEFAFGGGYSSLENAFAMASISQHNLFGRGQVLRLQAEIGGTTTQYRLSFTEPWLFDIPLSAGFDLYDWKVSYDSYDKKATGGGLRFGYPVFKNARLYLSNIYEVNEITRVTAFAPLSIQEMERESVTSSVSTSLVYDTRDHPMNPRRGSRHAGTIQKAGGVFGGDVAFTKYTAETGWNIPLFWKTVGFLHSRGGYVHEGSDGYLPDYERFYLGGMNSLRGFRWRDIAVEEVREEGWVTKKGGDKYIQFNAEFRFPLFDEKIGLLGLFFYDTGNVFDNGESIDLSQLRESAGFGIRWFSPMGPIRLERGYILHPREGESTSGRWEFTIGTAF